MNALLKKRFTLHEYVVLSTVGSLFLQQKIAQGGADIYLGYPLVIFNVLLLAALNRLYIHPKHFAIITGVAAFSVVAAMQAATPLTAIAAQILGITLMSVYYFSVITGFDLSISDWMNIYSRFAFAVALFGILYFPVQLRVEPPGDATRLHSIFSEPSFFIYLTLPAIGWYFNIWLKTRCFGLDLLVFLASYALADSSLGFLGLGIMALLTFSTRLSPWKMIGAVAFGAFSFVGLFLASSNFRVRILDTFFAVSSSDLSKSNESTFAVLSNAYVTFQSFLDHPLLGVGIGGYQFQYQRYITDLTEIPKEFRDLNVNMFDASSLFFRSLVELGIVGLLALVAFLIVCSRVKGLKHLEIRNAILPFLIIRMGRYGAYFSLELFFFVAIYFLNFAECRISTRYAGTRPSDLNVS